MAINADKQKGAIAKAAIARLVKTEFSRSGHYLAPESPPGMLGNDGHHEGGPFNYGAQHQNSTKNPLKNAGT